MTSLSRLSGPPRAFEYATDFKSGSQRFAYVPNTAPWLVASPIHDDSPPQRKLSKKRSKKHKNHRSKSHKKHRKHRIGAYILQLIGFICLVVAAIKSFEPLTGVGFTLILIGYSRSTEKAALSSKSGTVKGFLITISYANTDISKDRKKERGTKHNENENARDRGNKEVKGQDLEMESEWVRSFETLSIRS